MLILSENMFCYQQRPFYSCEVISGHLVSMMSLKMYRPLPSCSGMKILCTYIFSLSRRQETTPKVLVFLSRWSWVIFRSCEALVLRLVEASPSGACPYPIVSDANKHSPSHPSSSSGSGIASLFLLCACALGLASRTKRVDCSFILAEDLGAFLLLQSC